ncbi:hypothetical protein OS493_038009 [Desmophyllum pertusum]|uniref:Uncharacterized protein n=1 Tax=Desmophyllum pertusum TaxID=174260 RepID=A0A9W9Y709_9CNID|nr:hypothetical protein OS493_038009 [Desmophyllum pertusum]
MNEFMMQSNDLSDDDHSESSPPVEWSHEVEVEGTGTSETMQYVVDDPQLQDAFHVDDIVRKAADILSVGTSSTLSKEIPFKSGKQLVTSVQDKGKNGKQLARKSPDNSLTLPIPHRRKHLGYVPSAAKPKTSKTRNCTEEAKRKIALLEQQLTDLGGVAQGNISGVPQTPPRPGKVSQEMAFMCQ